MPVHQQGMTPTYAHQPDGMHHPSVWWMKQCIYPCIRNWSAKHKTSSDSESNRIVHHVSWSPKPYYETNTNQVVVRKLAYCCNHSVHGSMKSHRSTSLYDLWGSQSYRSGYYPISSYTHNCYWCMHKVTNTRFQLLAKNVRQYTVRYVNYSAWYWSANGMKVLLME